MSSSPPRGFILAQWTLFFVPFAVLLSAALLVPEMLTPGGTAGLHWLDHAVGLDKPGNSLVPANTPLLASLRAVLCRWLAIAMLIPAIYLYILRGASDGRRRVALLFWTFAYVAYGIYFYIATFVIAPTSWVVPAFTTVLMAWWTIDMVVAWCADAEQHWVREERALALTFIVVVLAVMQWTNELLDDRRLGTLLAASVLLCLLVRLSQDTYREALL